MPNSTPSFDPNQPFQSLQAPAQKPGFDPGQSFDKVKQPFDPSQSFQKVLSGPSLNGVDLSYDAKKAADDSVVAGRKIMDLPGGLARTAISAAAGAAGVPGQANSEDWSSALKGEAPKAADYLKRAGVPEQAALDLPLLGHVTARGAEGMAADILTDPLSAVSALAERSPYIAKMIKPLVSTGAGEATAAVGEGIYKSAFSKADAALEAQGKSPLSDIFNREGFVGSQKSIADKAKNMATSMGEFRQSLYDKVDQAGVRVNLSAPDAFAGAEKVLNEMAEDPGSLDVAASLEKMLNSYKQEKLVPISTASDWKTGLYNKLPDSAFSGAAVKKDALRFKQALANDFRTAIVDAGNTAEKGLGDAIETTNDKWGTLLSSMKTVNKQAAPSSGMTIDGIVAGIGAGLGGPLGAVQAVAAKKGMQAIVSAPVKTALGQVMQSPITQGIVDTGARRMMMPNPPAQPQSNSLGASVIHGAQGVKDLEAQP